MRLHDQGKRLPKSGRAGYAEMLGQALRNEFGEKRFATKTVGRWTEASERTIKNWFSGRALPAGHYLIRLIARSDAALEMVLAASRRADLLEAFYALSRHAHGPTSRPRAPAYVTNHDPVRGPNGGTSREVAPPTRHQTRCTWFVAELIAGGSPNLTALQLRFGIAARTAKRDVASLRANGVIVRKGTSRDGRYILGKWKGVQI